ncbi:MAG: hypothetical protein ACTSRW_16050 [Candidatus Helarchaeota archaeon]
MSQAQTTLDSFFEHLETASNRIEDKIALIYAEAEKMSQRIDTLMLQFKNFLAYFNVEIKEIKTEFMNLKEGLHE